MRIELDVCLFTGCFWASKHHLCLVLLYVIIQEPQQSIILAILHMHMLDDYRVGA